MTYFRGIEVDVNSRSWSVQDFHSSMMSSGSCSSQETWSYQSRRRRSLARMVMGEKSPKTSKTLPTTEAIDFFVTLAGMTSGVET